jgi:hypothetical protein
LTQWANVPPRSVCRPAPSPPSYVLDCIILKHNGSLQFSLAPMLAKRRYHSWVAQYHMQVYPNIKHKTFYTAMKKLLPAVEKIKHQTTIQL